MFKSRKFLMTLGLSALYTVLLYLGKLTDGTFAGLMGSLVPLYFAANVGQKVWAPSAGETPPAQQ